MQAALEFIEKIIPLDFFTLHNLHRDEGTHIFMLLSTDVLLHLFLLLQQVFCAHRDLHCITLSEELKYGLMLFC